MIVPLALRIAATRALEGATSALAVFDSAIVPIDELVVRDPTDVVKPVVVVATEDETVKTAGKDILGGERTLEFVVEIASVGAYVVQTIDGVEVREIRIPQSDDAIEMSVAIIARQVNRVLWMDGGTWGAMFRRLAGNCSQVSVRRGAGADKGARFAARQITHTLAPLLEPSFGGAPEGIWADFLALCRADEAIADDLADAIEATIVGEEIPDWRRLYTVLGYDDATGLAIGLAPFILPPEEPAVLDEVEVVDEDGGTPVILDETSADEQFPEAP